MAFIKGLGTIDSMSCSKHRLYQHWNHVPHSYSCLCAENPGVTSLCKFLSQNLYLISIFMEVWTCCNEPSACTELVLGPRAGALIDCLHEGHEIVSATPASDGAGVGAVHLLSAFPIQAVRNRPEWLWQTRSHLEIYCPSLSKIRDKLKWPKLISDVFCIMWFEGEIRGLRWSRKEKYLVQFIFWGQFSSSFSAVFHPCNIFESRSSLVSLLLCLWWFWVPMEASGYNQ